MRKCDFHISARLESDLLTSNCLNAGFQNICPVFQKLKILIGPFHPKTTHDNLSLKDKSFLSCVWVNQNSWTTMWLLPLEAPDPSSSSERLFGLTRLCVSQTATLQSVQFSSVAQSCPTLCNPMNHSTPGLPVHHQLPEFTQTHVH